jgi:hypothetical protein
MFTEVCVLAQVAKEILDLSLIKTGNPELSLKPVMLRNDRWLFLTS